MNGKNRKYLFSLTQGRTGTHYLTKLFSSNFPEAEVHHEILGWDRFGVDTPDISHMTIFNSQGNTQKIQDFWKQKLDRIIRTEAMFYAETSHVLMKAGLVENISSLLLSGEVHFVCLTRDIVKTIVSYLKGSHFDNRGMWWMWYLDPEYPKKILSFTPFRQFGTEGVCLWYIYEIQARIDYYKLLFKDIRGVFFHDVRLEDLNNEKSAGKLFCQIGLPMKDGKIIIPPPQSVSDEKKNVPYEYEQAIRNFVEKMRFDTKKDAEEFFNAEYRL